MRDVWYPSRTNLNCGQIFSSKRTQLAPSETRIWLQNFIQAIIYQELLKSLPEKRKYLLILLETLIVLGAELINRPLKSSKLFLPLPGSKPRSNRTEQVPTAKQEVGRPRDRQYLQKPDKFPDLLPFQFHGNWNPLWKTIFLDFLQIPSHN